MAPPAKAPEQSISYTEEYNDFISKLAEYHQKRGTQFDPEPRVGTKIVDLLALFKAVVEKGGYDKVSDEKLMWRKISQDFNLGNANLAATAFSLKTTYYKYLVAYEMSTIHKKEPPPKEILEETTARGANVLTRTVENFRPSSSRERGNLGLDSGESGDDGTPVRDRIGSEDTPGSGGRATRGLRQAPPQRVLFQPDTLPARQSRQTPILPPTRGASTSYHPTRDPDSISDVVTNYEPRTQMPLTLRPVITPGNNPTEFKKLSAVKEQLAAASKPTPSQRIMLPGTGFDGPNIYVRCLQALKSGIPAEQDYALHHLVKISMERGDKYRFESFPGLAEALTEKVLEVSSLFYEVSWEIVYPDDGRARSASTLDGLEGTPDILQRLSKLVRKDVDDNLHPAAFADILLQVNEAALTLRNMVLLEENASYISEMHLIRDMLSIVLHLPKLDSVVELKHYTLDIAEQLTKYLHLDSDDPLYISLLEQLESPDRGTILTSLRAITRISMNLEDSNRLEGIPVKTLQRIFDWTLLDDEELVGAALDFFYQYTAIVPNINLMLLEMNLAGLVSQLTRLLVYGSKIGEKDFIRKQHIKRPPPSAIPNLPQDLHQYLNTLEEPERSSTWLRCLFEEDRDESITQIALWQAYQQRFAPAIEKLGRPLLPAAEFIKNVSTTFADKAAAQVQVGPVQKFIIKGIRIRDIPVDINGRPYAKCQWTLPTKAEPSPIDCNEWFMTGEQMWNHLLVSHADVQKDEVGKFKNPETEYICRWDGCTKYPVPQKMLSSKLASHFKTHVRGPDFQPVPATVSSQNGNVPVWMTPHKSQKFQFQTTQQDERGDAAGLPLAAVLVLRNIARNISKTEAEDDLQKETPGLSYIQLIFGPFMQKLWDVFAHNPVLVCVSCVNCKVGKLIDV
jgi:chromatin structure-remodeling complex subunit RSC9